VKSEPILRILWVAVFLAVLTWSAIGPKDYPTWLLEVLPALVGFALVVATYRRFRLTPVAYGLILLHCVVLMVGGHYTYAEVPFFDILGHWLGWERNNYDKLGHFMQGLVPAILAREILIRCDVIRGDGWRVFLILCFTLALSAFYELLEWWVALISEEAADAFLGTQGYVWDTQSDMAWALIGAITALVLLSPIHDRQLNKVSLRTDSRLRSRFIRH
jgi:putative membrane protein